MLPADPFQEALYFRPEVGGEVSSPQLVKTTTTVDLTGEATEEAEDTVEEDIVAITAIVATNMYCFFFLLK